MARCTMPPLNAQLRATQPGIGKAASGTGKRPKKMQRAQRIMEGDAQNAVNACGARTCAVMGGISRMFLAPGTE
jgi:hypothetical protein